jgi:hypothetical protein
MTTTEDIGETAPQRHDETNETLGDGIERLMAEADRRLKRLFDNLHQAARGSAAFEGGERDALRVLHWMDAKADELRVELDKLGRHAGDAAKKVKEHVSGKRHGEPTESDTASPHEDPNTTVD